MNQDIVKIILLASPVVIGVMIAAVNSNGVNDATEKAEAWARKAQQNVSKKKNWFSSYIIHPVLWMIVKFCDWTDHFIHRGIKNGVRVAATLYLIIAWCFLVYMAVKIVIIVTISLVVLYIIFKVLVNSNEDVKRGYDAGRNIVGAASPGKRVNPKTGVIQEEGLLGWNDTDQRIDPKTGKVQTEGTFGWNDTETRIDQETGNIQKEGLLGYNDTDTRINPETGIIQKKGLIGWVDTEERINPETGRHQKQGLLGWVDD